MNICVYCSSSDAVDPVYFRAAEELGSNIAARGHTLVYGGSNVGLMGAVARAVKSSGGRVVGVMPKAIAEYDIAFDGADEFVVTGTMRERKQGMEERADAFVALPGGFGTLEEIMEILTLKQLHYHMKPVVFLNINGFYRPLLGFFERFYQEAFAKPETKELYGVCTSSSSLMEYLESYREPDLGDKWFTGG